MRNNLFIALELFEKQFPIECASVSAIQTVEGTLNTNFHITNWDKYFIVDLNNGNIFETPYTFIEYNL